MDGVLGARIAAAGFAVAGLGLLWWRQAAGVVLLVTAMGLILVARRDAAPATEVSLARLVGDLGLRGPGHHVPAGQQVRLFIPADGRGPYLIPEVGKGAVHGDPPASVGLELDAPGGHLIRRWQQIDGLPAGQGPEEALKHLGRAMGRLGLATRVEVAASGDAVRIRMRLIDAAPALSAQDAGWHMQGGCAAQSFACGITALALGRPVRTTSSHTEADGTMILEVVAGTNA